MKSLLVIACVFGMSLSMCFAQSPAEMDLYEKLLKDDAESLQTVLKSPEGYSALILFVSAGQAFTQGKLEDSGFLFYAGQLRARFDQKCFPPKGTGGNSPFVLFAAISQNMGTTINPAVMGEPKTFAKVMARLEKWTPKAPSGYTPGYEFTERLTEKDAHEAAKQNRTEFLERMGELSKLLSDKEYFAAFRVVQAYNLADTDPPPTKEAHDKAAETMKRIEKEKKLKGFFSE